MKRLSLLLLLLMTSISWGQISVQPFYQPYQPIIVGIDSAIPSDAEVKIRWSLTPPDGASEIGRASCRERV